LSTVKIKLLGNSSASSYRRGAKFIEFISFIEYGRRRVV
jgi:hypothetical protein